MEFCPKCGGMILPQEVGEEDGEKEIVLKCSTFFSIEYSALSTSDES